MAKVKGLPPFLGTRNGVCYYAMDGRFYVRSASSLSGKRVKKDPAFAKTMKQSKIFKKASRIGSQVYWLLPAKKRKFGMFARVIGEVVKMLNAGMKEEEVTRRLPGYL